MEFLWTAWEKQLPSHRPVFISRRERCRTLNRIVWCWIGAAFIGVIGSGYLQGFLQEPSDSASADPSQYSAVISRYCVVCHNEKLKTGGLTLSKEDVTNPGANPEIWEKVVSKLRFRAMPPVPAPRPDEATYKSLVTYLEAALDRAAIANVNPGRSTAAHRLNRTEYTNVIRDLLGLEIDGETLLPADNSGGFDNLGQVLSVSPSLMEKYLSAARKISRLALGDASISPDIVTYTVSPNLVQGDRMSEDLPLGTRGGIAVQHHFPLDAEYVIKVRLLRAGAAGYVIGIAEPQLLDVRLDGSRIKLLQFGGGHVGKSGEDDYEGHFEQSQYERNADAGLEVRFPVKAGTHLIQIAFLTAKSVSEGFFSKRARITLQDAGAGDRAAGDPDVSSVSISGPFNPRGPGETLSRQKIFVCNPTNNGDEEEACARKILSTLAHRAYRRPVTDADVSPLLQLYRTGRSEGNFEAGIKTALQGLLISPHFLFRLERDPETVPPDTPYRVSDLELTSRLSFFLWSSFPDGQLLDVAERGELRNPAVLEQQVRRMLAHPRSKKALVDDFAGQWLLLRNVKTRLPNRDVFPEFDENLRQAFEQETKLFLESMLREDRPIPELLNADYTFANQRLALHYGIPDVYGSQFRRVQLTDENRKGLMSQGSILLLTAYANRTSVVQRGKWVLENILGVQVPDPPPNVPSLEEKAGGATGSLRQQMEEHRSNPACMGCHSLMDPIGFALENFDGIGKWRTVDDGAPIDASGVLPDGAKFQGVAGLREILQNRPELVVTAVTEKLLTYALGRTLEHYDAPAVRKIVREAASSDYRWSSIILGIVKSTPFQMRRSRPL